MKDAIAMAHIPDDFRMHGAEALKNFWAGEFTGAVKKPNFSVIHARGCSELLSAEMAVKSSRRFVITLAFMQRLQISTKSRH
jgi:hypothetical protein